MRVSPRTKVSTFKKRFMEEFGVDIKCHKGMSKGHIADNDSELHEICTGMEVERDFRLNISGNMHVSTVENEVTESLGFRCQILNPDGSNADNSITLGELRREYTGDAEPESVQSSPPVVQSSPPSDQPASTKKGCVVALLLSPILWLIP